MSTSHENGCDQSGSEVSESSLQRGYNGLRAVGDIQTHEDGADVGFYGGFLDVEFVCDFVIAFSLHE